MKKYIQNIEIDNEIIRAEYFEMDDNEIKYFDKSFSLMERIEMFFRRMKHRARDIYYEIYYGFERMFKDYDEVDIISLHSKFVERYYKILTDYKNTLHGHPINLTQEEWDNIINDMLKHLYYMDEENVEKELLKGVSKGWIPTIDIIEKVTEKHKEEFFKLFSEYFYNLWD